jgi:hypothetical protein
MSDMNEMKRLICPELFYRRPDVQGISLGSGPEGHTMKVLDPPELVE